MLIRRAFLIHLAISTAAPIAGSILGDAMKVPIPIVAENWRIGWASRLIAIRIAVAINVVIIYIACVGGDIAIALVAAFRYAIAIDVAGLNFICFNAIDVVGRTEITVLARLLPFAWVVAVWIGARIGL